MRFALPFVLALVPSVAFAEDSRTVQPTHLEAKATPVIGGSAAPAGKWPDAVGVLYGGQQECSGTLIAPNVVITAGHCVVGGAPDYVLIGASALSRASEGETIKVMKAIEYPSSQSTIDIGILVLAQPSKFTPRPIASGWGKFEILNNAAVEFVGFGTTDKNGTISTDNLMEAQSIITDFDCTTSSGCNVPARPDGELGAGGMGIDTCPGDSGGPMYLMTDFGTFLAGVTSRSYDNATYACGEGGIYERPDKVIDWIAQQTGAEIAHAPTPTLDPPTIEVVRGNPIELKVTDNDPRSTKHTYTIKTAPGYAKAAVNSTGTLRVCAPKTMVGMDSVTFTIADATNPSRSIDMTVPINIIDGSPDDSCDVNAFGDDGGGCCSASRDARGSILLAAIVLGALRRRRRTR